MYSLINCVSSSALGQNVELVDFDETSRDENVDPLQPSHPELPFEFCGSCRVTSALMCPYDNLTTWARVKVDLLPPLQPLRHHRFLGWCEVTSPQAPVESDHRCQQSWRALGS